MGSWDTGRTRPWAHRHRLGGLNLTHVTPLSRFRRIWSERQLAPQPCRVLNGEVLYCAYGDVVVRPSGEQKGWQSDPPVVLVLRRSILSGFYAFAPVDTGAFAAGRVRGVSDKFRSDLCRHWCVLDWGGRRLQSWISGAYGSDDDYVARRPARVVAFSSDEAFVVRELCQATAKADGKAVDDLRMMSQIECHFDRAVPLCGGTLAAVHLPEEARAMAGEIAQVTGALVRIHNDQPWRGDLPDAIAAKVRRDVAELGQMRV